MFNLIGLIRLTISICRLLWTGLKLAWTHSDYLRQFVDRLRAVVADKQLAVHGVSFGSEALAVATMRSVEIQRLSDSSRALLQTDLLGHLFGAAATGLRTLTMHRSTAEAVLRNESLVDAAFGAVMRTAMLAETYPQETEDVLWETINFLNEPPANASASYLREVRADAFLLRQVLEAFDSDLDTLDGRLAAQPPAPPITQTRDRISAARADLAAAIGLLTTLIGQIDAWLATPTAAALSTALGTAAALETRLMEPGGIAIDLQGVSLALQQLHDQSPAIMAPNVIAMLESRHDDSEAARFSTITFAAKLARLRLLPVEQSALKRAKDALIVARTVKPSLQQLATDVEPLVSDDLAKSSLGLAATSARTLSTVRPELADFADDLTAVVNEPPRLELFDLLRNGATLVWKRSPELLSLMNGAGDKVVAAGDGAVASSYILNGADATTGAVMPQGVVAAAVPTAPVNLNVVNARIAMNDVHTLLDSIATNIVNLASTLYNVPVTVPVGSITGSNGFTVKDLSGNDHTIYTTLAVDLSYDYPLRSLSAALDDPANPANEQTFASKTSHCAALVGTVRDRLRDESRQLFQDGVNLIGIGRTLQRLAVS